MEINAAGKSGDGELVEKLPGDWGYPDEDGEDKEVYFLFRMIV